MSRRDMLVRAGHRIMLRITLRMDSRDTDNKVAPSHYKMSGANKLPTNLLDMDKCERWGFWYNKSHDVLQIELEVIDS